MKSLLLVRIDRIGDLVLSLPVDEILDSTWKVTWAIPKNLGFLPENSDPKRAFAEFGREFKYFWSFLKLLRDLDPDAAVVFHAPWWVSFALWVKRIPLRGGVLSQWHSFLFFNRGLRQKRSRGESHELEYNLDLICEVLNVSKPSVSPSLQLLAPGNQSLLSKYSLKPQNYCVVHPGMGGSALNWSVGSYVALIKRLAETQTVVVTGTVQDQKWVSPIREQVQSSHVVWLDQKLSILEVLDILKNSQFVVAPSTGIVHLAASLGTPTVGIYSPLRAESPTRWAPKGKRVRTLVPNIASQKHDSDVMRFLKVEDVLESIKEIVK